ncbi:MAG: alpha-L-fucosidase [Bacteroidales bacterium]
MKISRLFSVILVCMLLVLLANSCNTTPQTPAPEPKKFTPSFTSDMESFRQYQYPEWFRDAKFGIWAHWGPQAVPRQGDWYARKMYESDIIDRKTNKPTGKVGSVYKYHVEHYGHPSKFGYKDIIPLWKAERWDPEKLMALYKRAGARYFVSMASHHDNFFLWDSKIHRWNSVQMGPMKDVVGLWQKAAKNEGLKFGVSEHLGASFTWFQTSRGSDKTGPMKGIPYDGNNPAYEDLYHKKTAPDDNKWLTNDPENQKIWLESIKELIDNYHPDLLYSDSELPFGETGREMLAHYYNSDIQFNSGILNAVYTCKHLVSEGRWVRDIERGAMDTISVDPWQTDTSIGDWYYRTGQKYMSGDEVIQMLVDIVSKNGNLLLNVVQTPEGDLEQDVLDILEVIAAWTPVNGEGIYGSRPWKIYGEGPSTIKQEKGVFGGVKDVRPYEAQDIRFTSKGNFIYAYVMDRPQSDVIVHSLGKSSKYADRKIKGITLLGAEGRISFKQEDEALVIKMPATLPSWKVLCFRIELKK